MSFDCVLGAWRAHEQELRGFLIHRIGDVHAADDLLQDVFLKSMRQGADFCSLDNPRAWLFQVARNALIDRTRITKAFVELPEQLAVRAAEDPDPVAELDACLVRNLAEMTPEDREIIEQCDLQGVKQQAFADSHGLGLAAVKSRLLRARQRLRVLLTGNCQVRFDESGNVCCHTPRDGDAPQMPSNCCQTQENP